MGAVYLARQLTLDRDVALKILSPALSGAPALVARFMREAYAAGQITHHNVVQVYDFGKKDADGTAAAHFFSMELVDGGSLQARLDGGGPADPREAVGLVLQAARGLAFAHGHGLIHRDVKPDNLMVNRLGVVKVADLGLVRKIGLADIEPDGPAAAASGEMESAASAKLTHAAAMMGTPAYVAPEQAKDAKAADARADVYSLGCTLYHLLVGRPPFEGRTVAELIDAHARRPLRFPKQSEGGPAVDDRLKDVVKRMCAKSPADRHPTMDAVVDDLEAYLRDGDAAALEPAESQKKALDWSAAEFCQKPVGQAAAAGHCGLRLARRRGRRGVRRADRRPGDRLRRNRRRDRRGRADGRGRLRPGRDAPARRPVYRGAAVPARGGFVGMGGRFGGGGGVGMGRFQPRLAAVVAGCVGGRGGAGRAVRGDGRARGRRRPIGGGRAGGAGGAGDARPRRRRGRRPPRGRRVGGRRVGAVLRSFVRPPRHARGAADARRRRPRPAEAARRGVARAGFALARRPPRPPPPPPRPRADAEPDRGRTGGAGHRARGRRPAGGQPRRPSCSQGRIAAGRGPRRDPPRAARHGPRIDGRVVARTPTAAAAPATGRSARRRRGTPTTTSSASARATSAAATAA